ncbi:MAG TPA: hypothetical protein VFI82_04480 [Terriglobales bacterium]|nr:hypothetical protein [Terriglobales bacterium]
MAAVPEKPLGVTLTSAAKKQKGGHGSPPIHADLTHFVFLIRVDRRESAAGLFQLVLAFA